MIIFCNFHSDAAAKDIRSGQPYNNYVGATEAESPSFQMLRHSQIIQQCSTSTDEGCDTDHGEMEDVLQPSVPPSIQRLNSYASSSSSSGVVTNFPSKSLSQNLSCESSRSNFSTFESLDLNLSDCSDLAASLPSCASTLANTVNDNSKDHGKFISISINFIVSSYFHIISIIFHSSLWFVVVVLFFLFILYKYLTNCLI